MLILDRLISSFDRGLRTLAAPPRARRASPAETASGDPPDDAERTRSGRLLRVDHCGEVCAQALYQGQALTARNERLRATLDAAADEEVDHLAWCADRLTELGASPSVLNPLFYAGSFALGALAGALGDRWNLGFVMATERQVEGHLAGHLERIAPEDTRSRAILVQMKQDEAGHADAASREGAVELPAPVQTLMRAASQVMTSTTYWV